jgi:tetratricopeptide (TPR) repeat protein
MSPRVRRWILLLLAVEAAVCAGLVAARLLRPVPQLPAEFSDDPLAGRELAAVARKAADGGAADWLELGQGLYGHAEPVLRRAVGLDPRSVEARFALGFVLDRTGRTREGNAEYTRLLELPEPPGPPGASKKAYALYQIGRNHLRDGDVAAAEGAFRRNPGMPQAEHQLARILLRSARPKEATEVLLRARDRLPLALELHHAGMQAMEALGRPEEAFRAAALEERGAHLVEVSFNTDYVRPFASRHGLRRQLDEYLAVEGRGDAAEIAARLDAIDAAIGGRPLPERLTTLRIRATRRLQARDAAGALALVEELRAAGDRGPGVLETEAAARRLRGEHDAALALLERAAAMEPNASRHRQLADEYDRRGDAAARDRHLAAVRFHEGIDAYRHNRPDLALERLRLAVGLDDTDATAWFHVGEMEYHLGRHEEADKAFRRALELRPGYGRARDWLERRPP